MSPQLINVGETTTRPLACHFIDDRIMSKTNSHVRSLRDQFHQQSLRIRTEEKHQVRFSCSQCGEEQTLTLILPSSTPSKGLPTEEELLSKRKYSDRFLFHGQTEIDGKVLCTGASRHWESMPLSAGFLHHRLDDEWMPIELISSFV